MSRPFLVSQWMLDTSASRKDVAVQLAAAWRRSKVRAKYPIAEIDGGYRITWRFLKATLDMKIEIDEQGSGCRVWGRILRADVWQQKMFALIPAGTRHSYGEGHAKNVFKNLVSLLHAAGFDAEIRATKVPFGAARVQPPSHRATIAPGSAPDSGRSEAAIYPPPSPSGTGDGSAAYELAESDLTTLARMPRVNATGPTGVGDRPAEPDRRSHGHSQPVVLQLDTGEVLTVSGLLWVGRSPSPPPSEGPAGLMVVDDPSYTVSKTHFACGLDARGAWVQDCHSRNGTTLVDEHGRVASLTAGRKTRVPLGVTIVFGARRAVLTAVH